MLRCGGIVVNGCFTQFEHDFRPRIPDLALMAMWTIPP